MPTLNRVLQTCHEWQSLQEMQCSVRAGEWGHIASTEFLITFILQPRKEFHFQLPNIARGTASTSSKHNIHAMLTLILRLDTEPPQPMPSNFVCCAVDRVCMQ